MNCPTCGLVNIPEALRYDCGFDFVAGKASGIPGWPIRLTWSQRAAASWSIFWPGWAVIGLLLIVLPGDDRIRSVLLQWQLALYSIQSIVIHRLVRKNFQSFRVYVIRKDGERPRRLAFGEGLTVWLRFVAPQLAYSLLGLLFVSLLRPQLSTRAIGEVSSLLRWPLFLVVGPYAIDLALRGKYSKFRLAAYGLRHDQAEIRPTSIQ